MYRFEVSLGQVVSASQGRALLTGFLNDMPIEKKKKEKKKKKTQEKILYCN